MLAKRTNSAQTLDNGYVDDLRWLIYSRNKLKVMLEYQNLRKVDGRNDIKMRLGIPGSTSARPSIRI